MKGDIELAKADLERSKQPKFLRTPKERDQQIHNATYALGNAEKMLVSYEAD